MVFVSSPRNKVALNMAGFLQLKIYYAGPGLQVNKGFLNLFIGFQGYVRVHAGAPHFTHSLSLPCVAGGQACGVWLITNGNF